MSLYADWILPWLIEAQLGKPDIAATRAELLRGLSGEVLEVGFGSGLSLPHYPRAVTRLYVLDPHRPPLKRVAARIAAASFPVVTLPYPGDGPYPLAEGTVDAVVSFFTLCTIPDVAAALREMRRILKPGGTFAFLEHGASEQARVLAWQRRLTPLQKRIAGGCHLDRPIDRLVEAAGFAALNCERIRLPSVPGLAGRLYRGSAVR
jgi:SAM-dependent methyltransferase